MANVIDGVHLVLDGKSKDVSLFSKDNIEKLLVELVDVMEMTIIFGPMVEEVPVDPAKLTGDVFKDEGGVSGLCLVNTSHVALHCWPMRNFVMFDASSCKRFDPYKVVSILRERLGLSAVRAKAFVRNQSLDKPNEIVLQFGAATGPTDSDELG